MSLSLENVLAACADLSQDRNADLRQQLQAWAKANPADTKRLLDTRTRDKSTRGIMHACAMAYPALGIINPWQLDARVEELLKFDVAGLKQHFNVEIAPFIVSVDVARQLAFGWTFNTQGTTQLRVNCERAMALVPVKLKGALTDLERVLQGQATTQAYQDYFGNYNEGYARQVKSCLIDVLTAALSKTTWLYYRGAAVQRDLKRSDWPFLAEFGGVTAEDHFGATVAPRAQRDVSSNRNALQANMSDAVHIKIGKLSETLDAEKLCHTLIHEFTHYVCGTRDVKFNALAFLHMAGHNGNAQLKGAVMIRDASNKLQPVLKDDFKTQYKGIGAVRTYDVDQCKAMAATTPEKAVWNADNYACYCMAC